MLRLIGILAVIAAAYWAGSNGVLFSDVVAYLDSWLAQIAALGG